MSDFLSKMRRRTFLAGSATAVGLLALPAFAQSKPLRVGQTLPLTGPLSGAGKIRHMTAEIFVKHINAQGGILGRPVEYVLYDDQSQPNNTRTLYEKLVTSVKVDLLIAPYSTSSVVAALGVAQKFGKVFIQSSQGVPSLAPYDMQFTSLPIGPEPELADTELLVDGLASTTKAPKTIAIVTSKFPSALSIAKGAQEVADKRGLQTVLSLEYEFGTKDFGPIAGRIKSADPDLLWSGAVGQEAVKLMEAMAQIDYSPKWQFYLFPDSGLTAASEYSEGAMSLTGFEEHEPFLSYPGASQFVADFDAKAKELNLPYPHVDFQAALEYAGWQILAAAAEGAGEVDDKAMAEWLRRHEVQTVLGPRSFEGKYNAGKPNLKLRQVQSKRWVAVYPTEYRPNGVEILVR